ncbi:MAG: patatin-like phospholipase family protein [Caldilineaceae bacterium]|nr:patatin-like phospholipase family protein [Caldilineaceae bacterium]
MNFNDESLYPPYAQPNGQIPGNRRGKTALVLAGGGITGAVYEIGALRAVNDMLVDRTVNDFDIYVGTSAGSLVTSMLANGMTPEEMMQSIDNSHPEIRSIRANEIFQTNLTEFFHSFTRLPGALLRGGRNLFSGIRDRTLADLFWEFADLLPSGLYSGGALERYVEEVLTRPGCVNRFDHLQKELYIIATDLDTGERAVFGKGGKGIVPISKAVAASSAIPIVYKPVRIFGREYVDGSMRGTASLDLAVEAGADLVVCINPLVPLNTQDVYPKDEHIGDEGMRTVINQVVRILMHSGLRYHIKSLRRQYPDVDFILIEPQPDDQKMFGYNLMDYSSRLRVANHGFESVTVRMTDHYDYFSEIMERHDIQISRGRVDAELDEIRSGHGDALLFDAAPSSIPNQPPITQAMLSLESSLARLGQLFDSRT